MVRRALFWSLSTQIANFFIQFGGTVIMARLLNPHEFGIFAVAVAVMGALQSLTIFGVSTYVVRETDLTPEKLDTAFTINAIVCFMVFALLMIAGAAYLALSEEAGIGHVLIVMSVTPLLSIPSFRPTVMLQRELDFKGISIIGTFAAFVGAATMISSALAGASFMSQAYGIVVTGALGSLGVVLIGATHFSMRMSLAGWRSIARFGFRLMSISGVSVASTRLSDVIVGHVLGVASFGLYARASNLNLIVFQNIYGALTRIVFAKLSEANREGDKVAEVFLQGFRMILGLMGPILLGMAVFSGPIIFRLYGIKWQAASLPLTLLLLGQFFSLMFAMNWELFVVRDEMKTQTRLEVMRSMVTLVLQSSASLLGLVGVAAANLFASLFSVAIYQPHMPRLTRANPSVFYRIYLEFLEISILTVTPALVVMFVYRWQPDVPFVALFGAMAVSAVLWLSILRWRAHPLWDEILRVLRRVWRR